MIELYSTRDRHEHEPGDPRATSQQGFVYYQKQDIESTYHGVFVDGDNIVTMATPLIFFFYGARSEDVHQFQEKI